MAVVQRLEGWHKLGIIGKRQEGRTCQRTRGLELKEARKLHLDPFKRFAIGDDGGLSPGRAKKSDGGESNEPEGVNHCSRSGRGGGWGGGGRKERIVSV